MQQLVTAVRNIHFWVLKYYGVVSYCLNPPPPQPPNTLLFVRVSVKRQSMLSISTQAHQFVRSKVQHYFVALHYNWLKNVCLAPCSLSVQSISVTEAQSHSSSSNCLYQVLDV